MLVIAAVTDSTISLVLSALSVLFALLDPLGVEVAGRRTVSLSSVYAVKLVLG